MAVYLGSVKVAGLGSGSANIVSCDSYEDYMSRTHDLKTMYVTPDQGAGSQQFVPLSDFELLSADLYGKLSSILSAINDDSETFVVAKISVDNTEDAE